MNFKDILNHTELKQIEQVDNDLFLKILKIRNEKKIRENMVNQGIISEQDHIKWFNNQILNKTKKFFCIYYKLNLNGLISLDTNNKSWAFYISSNSIKGLGAIVEYVFLNKVFLELIYKNIYCEVFDYNQRVLSLHKKFGFQIIATKKKFSKFLNKEANLVQLELSRERWDKIKRALDKKFI